MGVYSTPRGLKVETKNHHKTMKIKVPEAKILRTPIKIEKLSWWNRSGVEFIMNFEFHGFLEKTLIFFSLKIEQSMLFMLLPYKSKSAHPCLVGRIELYVLNMGVPTSIYRVKCPKKQHFSIFIFV